jgi:hypothetical protein
MARKVTYIPPAGYMKKEKENTQVLEPQPE